MNAKRSRMPATRSQSQLEVWRKRLDEFERRDCSVVDYCKELGVSAPTFYYWRKKLGKASDRRGARSREKRLTLKRTAGISPRRSSFLPVVLSTQLNRDAVSIELPSGVRVCIPTDAQQALSSVLDRVIAST